MGLRGKGKVYACRGAAGMQRGCRGGDGHPRPPPTPRAHLPAGARPPLPSAPAVPAGRRHRPARSGHRPGAGLAGPSPAMLCAGAGRGAWRGRERGSPERRESGAVEAGKPRTPPSHLSIVAAVWGCFGFTPLRRGPAPSSGNKSLTNPHE